MLTRDEIREILITNGFKIYEGLDDLKPYVYTAAYALIEAYINKISATIATESKK